MQKRKVVEVPLSSIPVVGEFVKAQNALETFKEQHEEVFNEYKMLVEDYNTKLQNAGKVVRQQEVSCGPFILQHFSTKFEAEKLHGAVGRAVFMEIGGKLGTKTTYDVDRDKLEAAIAQGKLPDDLVESIKKEVPSYKAPKEVSF